TTEEESTVFYGACVTHAAIEDRRVPDPSRGLMPQVAEGLAYRAIRNRGTLGGSLALADPAAEWPSVLVALDAAAVIAGPNGTRAVMCREFVTGIVQTLLAEGGMLTTFWGPTLWAEAR